MTILHGVFAYNNQYYIVHSTNGTDYDVIPPNEQLSKDLKEGKRGFTTSTCFVKHFIDDDNSQILIKG